MVHSPVQCDAFGLGTVDSMMLMTEGKRERVTPSTMNTDTAYTQISLKILQNGGDTSSTLTSRDAFTAERRGRERELTQIVYH